ALRAAALLPLGERHPRRTVAHARVPRLVSPFVLDLDENPPLRLLPRVGVVGVGDVLNKGTDNVAPHRCPRVLPERPRRALDLPEPRRPDSLDQCAHDHFRPTSFWTSPRNRSTSLSSTSSAAARAASTF